MKKFNKDKYLRKLRLRSFYRKYGKYFYIGITCLLVAVIGIYFAFSKYNITTEETVINMKVGNFVRGDIVLIPYVEEQYSKSFPKKGEGYTVNNILCNKDVKAEWDVNNWKLFAGDLTKKTKCSIYFTKSKTYEFQFASKEETFKAPVSGIYRLEAWGAFGGGEGGVGSYSTGKVYLDNMVSSVDYEIVAKLVIKNSDTLTKYYEKEYVLVPKTNDSIGANTLYNLKKQVDIDYDYYNNIATTFKS